MRALSQEQDARRADLPARSAAAFAPAGISNFFAISYDDSRSAIGATGGGYVLSKGVTTRARVLPNGDRSVATTVNGDPNYNARTTRRAVSLLAKETGSSFGLLALEQEVDVPIGSGFGASAASAISAVFAVGEALGLKLSKEELAMFAHRAEIAEQTGLGTVSVTFDAVGAGAIVKPGVPGEAVFTNVKVPKGFRVVTAYLAPFDKKDAFSSRSLMEKINVLGDHSLASFVADPTLDNLAEQGEWFSANLGLESREVKKLISIAKKAGATHASQNMIGHSIHALSDEDSSLEVARVIGELGVPARVGVYEVGKKKAGLVEATRRRRAS